MEQLKQYYSWRSDKDGVQLHKYPELPYIDSSLRNVLERISKIENVVYHRWEPFVKLKNGDRIHVSCVGKI